MDACDGCVFLSSFLFLVTLISSVFFFFFYPKKGASNSLLGLALIAYCASFYPGKTNHSSDTLSHSMPKCIKNSNGIDHYCRSSESPAGQGGMLIRGANIASEMGEQM